MSSKIILSRFSPLFANEVEESSSKESFGETSADFNSISAEGLSRAFSFNIFAMTLCNGSEYFVGMEGYLPAVIALFKEGKLSPRKGGLNAHN
jgi:hypothetical protein